MSTKHNGPNKRKLLSPKWHFRPLHPNKSKFNLISRHADTNNYLQLHLRHYSYAVVRNMIEVVYVLVVIHSLILLFSPTKKKELINNLVNNQLNEWHRSFRGLVSLSFE